MIELRLGQGAGRPSGIGVLVDAEDVERLGAMRWSPIKFGGAYYAVTRKGTSPGGLVSTFMHRLIMDAQPDELIDHANGDGLDNRKANLRRCTRSQNAANALSHRNSSSRFKGVSWAKSKKRWQATITVDYRSIFLGRYVIEEDAARAYDDAAVRYFGEFARLNLSDMED